MSIFMISIQCTLITVHLITGTNITNNRHFISLSLFFGIELWLTIFIAWTPTRINDRGEDASYHMSVQRDYNLLDKSCIDLPSHVHVCIVRGWNLGLGFGLENKDQKMIKGTTKPLMANLDIIRLDCRTFWNNPEWAYCWVASNRYRGSLPIVHILD